MDPQDFVPGQRTCVRRARAGYWNFVPPPLPPKPVLTPTLVGSLSLADRAIGELSGMGRVLPDARPLTIPLLRNEAVLSSRIEGTQATLSDLVMFEATPGKDVGADVREVANYVRAADHALDPERRLPLSLPLLLEAHGLLMDGVGGGHATPGEFRRSQNWIGPPGSLLAQATFVPPEPDEMWSCLDLLEKYLHADDDLPPLLRIAAIHYQFEAIHPFLDGNGRIGRLLVLVLMVEWGLLPGPLLDISAYIEPRRDAYYAALLGVSTNGDWGNWFGFFLDAVATQCAVTQARATRLRLLREDYLARVRSPRGSVLPSTLVDALFAAPATTIGAAAELLGVTHRAATGNVEKLVAAGILTEVPPRGRTRLFVAAEIISVLTARG